MRSPDFCCPRCGGRDWWAVKEGWICKHSAPSFDFTDFRPWLAYQLEYEQELTELLSAWESKKATKLAAGKAALVETTEIGRCQAALSAVIANVRLGLWMEALADTFEVGKLEVGRPPLRFVWSVQRSEAVVYSAS